MRRRGASLDRLSGPRREHRFDPEDSRYLAEVVEQMALGQRDKSRVLAELGRQAQTPESAHGLLLGLGVWDATVDPYPRRWILPNSPPCSEPAPIARGSVARILPLPAFAIDNEGTNDPDDAISLDPRPTV